MIAVRGDYAPLGNLPVVATFTLTDTPGAPLQLTGVAARLFGSRDGGLGWVWVPAHYRWSPAGDPVRSDFCSVIARSPAQVPPRDGFDVYGVFVT